MSQRSCLSVILAAGEGTRMKSALPKVLHQIAGLPMVAHVLNGGRSRRRQRPGAGDRAWRRRDAQGSGEVCAQAPRLSCRPKRLGTAHAVLAAREAIAKGADDLLIAFGDTPLIDGGCV